MKTMRNGVAVRSPARDERRLHPRYGIVGARAWVEPRTWLGRVGLTPARPCDLQDLSQGGAEVRSTKPLAPGTRVRLTVAIPSPTDAVSVTGIVLRSRSDSDGSRWRCGLRFDLPSPHSAEKLRAMESWFTSVAYRLKTRAGRREPLW